MKRLNLQIWFIFVVLALLVACGAPQTTSNTNTNTAEPTAVAVEEVAEPTLAPAEEVKLVVWATGSEDEAKVMQAAADLYHEANPNITVEIQPISWDDGHAKVLTAATSQQGPDLITGGLSWGIEFGELGGMVDLRGYQEELTAIEGHVHPNVYKSVTSPDGSVFGVPWDLTVYMMYYRPDLLEEVGAANPPKTWEEMTDAITKLKEAGKTGFAMQWGNTQWLQYFNYLYQAGGTLYAADCSASTINSEAGVEALKFYASLYKDYGVSTDGWPDMEGGLESGDLAFASSGSWVAAGLDASRPAIEGKWKMAPLPAGPSGNSTAFIGGRIIGIMSYTKAPAEAADFISFLYTEEAVTAMTAQASELSIFYIPPRADFADKIDAPADRIEALKLQLDDAVGPPNCFGWEESARIVEQQLQEVIFNGADPQTALDAAAKAMDEGLQN